MAEHKRSRTPADYAAALAEAHGLIAPAARKLDVSRAAVYNMLKHPEVREALDSARADLLDLAESKLYAAVNRGNLRAAMFVLDRLGRDRGYGKTVRFEAGGLSAQELAALDDAALEEYARELKLN